MANRTARSKFLLQIRERLTSAVGALVLVLFMTWAFWASSNPWLSVSPILVTQPMIALPAHGVAAQDCPSYTAGGEMRHETAQETFYDDPNLSYSIETHLNDWDGKRQEWLKYHESFAAEVSERILLLTGSQPSNCYNPTGDYVLLRLFKNKVDYCRIHGYDIFYNNANLHPEMGSYWAKISIIKAAMIAHPEVEWVWWIDSDAVFTDMEFKLPLERYKNHNLVVDGWPDMVYKKRSWIGVNAGVLLFRNCQWSMDFMDVWASMGPQTPNYEEWGKKLKSALNDKPYPISDDQSALVYLLLEQKDKWANKIYIENEYCLQCYWAAVIAGFDNVTEKYIGLEKKVSGLRRRHAEVVSEGYSSLREKYLGEAGYGKETGRRQFITHFTGCQPCSGDHNPVYAGNSCRDGLEKALNFADNQVLRNYGYGRSNLLNSKSLTLLPIDSPGI